MQRLFRDLESLRRTYYKIAPTSRTYCRLTVHDPFPDFCRWERLVTVEAATYFALHDRVAMIETSFVGIDVTHV
jgi:hypothetical protein